MTAGTLVRQARIVPVGPPAHAGGPPAHAGGPPVDLRIVDGVVESVAPRLAPAADDVVVEADGRWAAPGLWDQHVHLRTWARSRAILDLRGTDGPRAVARRVAEHVAALQRRGGRPDALVTGYGYRSATWAEPATVALLDEASGGHPVILMSGDAHNGWLSSAALRLLGQPPVDGPLQEKAWFDLQPTIATLTAGDDDALVREALAAAAARGVVGLVDLEMEPGFLVWPQRVALGMELLRVRVGTYPDRLEDLLATGLRTGDRLAPRSPLVTVGPLKIISDGSLNTLTAYCCEPYVATADPGATRGRQNYSPAELVDLVGRAHAHGVEAAVHAIGDAAVQVALETFAATGASGSIEHAQLMRGEDVHELARLGLRASVQPAHLLDDRDVTLQLWGDRAARCFPLRSLLAAGADLVLGSDAPVAPLDPWLAMAAAVHRGAPEEEPWNAAEALTVAEALAASTDGQGTVAPGSRGDLVLLDVDPLASYADSASAARHLRDMPVAATLVAGRPVHLAL